MAHSNAVQLAEHVGAALTADGATGIVTAYKFVGDGSSLTGIDATSIKDSAGNVKAQAYNAGVTVTGVLTATSFDGDGSALTGLPAGLGTATAASGDGAVFYYTNEVLDIGANLTLDSPSTAPVIYTQYSEVAVQNGVDLTIADGDELVTDILGISTSGTQTLTGTGGRVRTDTVTSRDTKGQVSFPSGINVSLAVTATDINVSGGSTLGIATATSVVVGSAVTANADGIIVGGAVTATNLVYGSTDVSTELATKATTGKAIAMAMVFG